MNRFLPALLAVLLVSVGPASAASWSFDPGVDNPPTAEVSLDRMHLYFQCVDKHFTFNLAMPGGVVPEAATTVSVWFAPDLMMGETTSYYENVQHERYGSSRSVFFIPDVMDKWLNQAAAANEKLNIGVAPMAADLKGSAVWMEFPVDGSSAAIKQLRDAC